LQHTCQVLQGMWKGDGLMVDRGLTRDAAADQRAQVDAIKFQMRTVEAVASAIQADPSIYQSIDKDRLALVMNGDWALKDVLYVFRMCKLKFKVEVVDGSYFDEWY
jgi:hypothetical protein